MHERQIQKLDQFIMQINSDSTLKHKFETINVILTNQLSNLKLEYLNLPHHVYKLINIDNSDSEHAEGNNEPVTSKINYDAVEMLLIDLKKY